jgi:TetR/AcrR family transcriptional regulator, regulator of mycofactocin system
MTVAGGLRERKKARTREALRDTAMELFSRQGFDGTTVEEIADSCEVSPRTFFRYFPTKEDVLFGDSELRCAALIEVLAAQPPELPPLVALYAAMRATALDYALDRKALVARSEIMQASPSLRAYKAEHQRGWEEAVIEELTRRVNVVDAVITPLDLRLLTATAIGALRVALDLWLADADADIVVLFDAAFARVSEGFGTLGR